MKVIFAGGGTGGHLYPGIAIARALVHADPKAEPFFVGAKRGIEREVLPKTEFRHVLLDLHPLYRSHFWQNWRTIVGGIGAWHALGAIVRREHPVLVVGTGGYGAGITMAYAVVHRIPMVQQAGDRMPGLTARGFARYSREIYLSFPEAAQSLHAHHAGSLIDTGAPIEPPPNPRPDRAAARTRWGFPATGGLVLLIYGGSQGSLAINRVVAQWIERGLPPKLNLIWGTGRSTYDQFKHLERANVRISGYLAPIASAYAAADFALARAGAMTTAELFAWGLPPVLVPLPTAAADHQTTNAKALEAAGAAILISQASLTADRLDATIRALIEKPERMAALTAAGVARARPNAATEIAQRIVQLIDRGK